MLKDLMLFLSKRFPLGDSGLQSNLNKPCAVFLRFLSKHLVLLLASLSFASGVMAAGIDPNFLFPRGDLEPVHWEIKRALDKLTGSIKMTTPTGPVFEGELKSIFDSIDLSSPASSIPLMDPPAENNVDDGRFRLGMWTRIKLFFRLLGYLWIYG